jgi:branched-chain amino acid transport system permease protein
MTELEPWETFLQHCLIGLTNGSLFALIAIGYTMVYGIIELVNFAHGDLVMLGSFLALTVLGVIARVEVLFGIEFTAFALIVALLIVVPLFCGGLNWSVDRVVYKPLRNAPRLAPLVSAIGVSFIFMNVGLLWRGPADIPFPELISRENVLSRLGTELGIPSLAQTGVTFNWKDLMVIGVTVPLMVGLTLFVKYTRLGTAMRATAQDPVAAQLMGIPSDRVIGATFLIGGALGGAASVVYALYVNVLSFQMGYQNGLYAFTAAVVGGIGKIPGAVLGGLIIGLVRSLSSGYLDERWTPAVIFGILIVILIFRPAGLLGDSRREKV